MARIIAEAAVRLVVDQKELGKGVRNAIRAAVRDAARDSGMFDPITRESDRSADRVNKTWTRALGGLRASLGSVLSVAGGIGKALLIGTAAGGALAGVASLTTGLFALVQAAVAASGAMLLVPAAMVAIKAATATLKIGLSGMDDAFKALGKDSAAFEESIKDLAPEAQKFMRTMRSLKPAFDQLKLNVQNRLFMGLSDILKDLSGIYLPIANRLFVGIAGSINSAAQNLGDFLRSGETAGQISGIVDNIRAAFENLVPAVVPFTQAMLTIVDVGSTFLPRLSASLATAAGRFSDFIDRAAGSGQLEAIIQRAIDTIAQLGRIAANVFATIGNVMDASAASGFGLLENLEKITRAARDFSGSFSGQAMISGFFAQLKRVVDALWPAVRTLVEVFVRDFVPILADLASIIGPVLQPLFAALGATLQALRPLIQAVAQAFATVLAALEPVFEAIADAVNDAMPLLQPVINDIADAFVNLIESMVPLIPLFFDLLEALLPIVPPLIQMVADLMPRLIEIIEAILPYIQQWAELMAAIIPIITAVADFLLGIFIPVLEVVMSIFTGLLEVITAVVTGIDDVIRTIFTGIADFFSGIWNTITEQVSAAWNGIASFFSSGLDGMWTKVKQFGSNIWNSIKTAMSNLVNAIKNGMKNMADGIGNGISTALRWFRDLPGRILGFFKDAGSWLFNIGKDILMGLWNGLKAMVGRIIDFFRGLVDDARNIVMDLLGIASPSKEFEWIGKMIGAGLINGMEGIAPAVNAAAADMVAGMANPLDVAVGFGGASGGAAATLGASGMIINQTNVMRPGTDVKQFSDLVLGRSVGDYLSGASTLSVARNGVQAGVNDQWVG